MLTGVLWVVGGFACKWDPPFRAHTQVRPYAQFRYTIFSR